MNSENTKNCPCPKETCPRHGDCYNCIVHHKDIDGLPYCIFPTTDKSLKNFYEHLKKRFEPQE